MSIKSIIARLQFYLNDTFVYVVRQKRAIAWSSSNPYKIIKYQHTTFTEFFPTVPRFPAGLVHIQISTAFQQILTLRLYSVAKTSPTVLHRNSPRALSLIHNVGDQAKVTLHKNVPGFYIALGRAGEVEAFFLLGQRFGEASGGEL